MMKLRVLVLGAGFGGLEISTLLSEKLGERLDLTLIDKNDSESITFFPHNVLISNKDGYRNEYPITFQNVRLNNNFICYTISSGLCNNGLSYS